MDLITKDVTVLGDGLEEILKKRKLRIYWGIEPKTEDLTIYNHIYNKIDELIDAGCQVTILIANLHTYLNLGITIEELDDRVIRYNKFFNERFKNIRIIKGSEFQLLPEYTLRAYKLMSKTNTYVAKLIIKDVLSSKHQQTLNGLIYPILQTIDEEILDVDAQLGDKNQEKIMQFSRQYTNKIHLILN